jgi:prolyl 4-hydroxylase
MHSSPSSFPISVSSFIQYTFLAVLAYILAGAPLLSILRPNSDPSSSSKTRDGSVDVGKLDNLVIPEKNLTCREHAYKGVYVLSREPLVVYIEGFLGEGEGEEVVKLRYVSHIISSFRRYGGKESCN